MRGKVTPASATPLKSGRMEIILPLFFFAHIYVRIGKN